MKLTVVLLIAAVFQVSAKGYSQQVTINEKDIAVTRLLQIIEKQTGYHFLYDKLQMKDIVIKQVAVSNASVEQVLNESFEGLPLSYKIIRRTIVVKRNKQAPSAPVVANVAPPVQQDIIITGLVTNPEGEPLVNVSVMIKGNNVGTTTDINGEFSIRVPDERAVLLFSYVGYESREITAGSQKNIRMVLQPAVGSLGDVVVVGYGVQSRKDLTGSISRVSGRDFKNAIVSTVDQALQGRAPGVHVTQASGEPGANVVVRIRGISSFSNNNQPLYVIDGFIMPPYTEAGAPNTSGPSISNGLYGLNPTDIESIDVLKDASATAIYGSRAANGVILITTKRGKTGESQIEFVNKTSASSMSNSYEMMNGYEFAAVKNQSYIDVGQPGPFNIDSIKAAGSTDWIDQISRTGLRQENSLNYRGGAGKTNYFLSGTYLVEQGVIKGSENKRGSIRFNLNTSFKPWYDARTQVSATRAKLTRATTETGGWPYSGGPIFDALRASPLHQNNSTVLGEVPDVVGGVVLSQNAFVSPVQELIDKTDDTFNDQVLANIENIFYLTKSKNLELHVLLGTSLQNSERQINLPPWLGSGKTYNGLVIESNAKTQSFNSSVYLSHKASLEDHSFVTTAGAEYNNIILQTNTASGKGINFSSIALFNLGSALNQSITSYKEESVIQSAFVRENYSFKNKYLLSASVRADGASKFAKNEKWALFPAAALAWNISEEEFLSDIKKLDFAKLRISYGLTGNQSLPAYRSLRSYTPSFYELGNTPGGGNPFVTLVVSQPNNPDLKWETTAQFNAGFDLSIFEERVTLAFDFYNKKTTDLLQLLPVPSQSGYESIWANMGSIRNRGIEFNVGLKPVNGKNFSWDMNFIYSKNKTILLDLGTFDPTSQGITRGGSTNLLGGGTTILMPGKELGLFYGYNIIGLYQQEDFDAGGALTVPAPQNSNDNTIGRYRYEDVDKDGKITEADRTVLGHSQPRFTLGWNNNLRWKNWNLNLFFNSSFGNDILNMAGAYMRTGILNLSGLSFNQTRDWYEKRWTVENPTNDPKYPAIQPKPNGGLLAFNDANSTMVEDGSFVRLKSATLAYSFTESSNKFLRGLSVFITGTNLFTITKYSGFDPEVSSYGADIKLTGIDYGAYPNYRGYTLGINLTF
ncbi:MAG: TonB-dependent receptor [Chitinophagaceae bacterium]|nr:TonB-dependent receptor [Chitinophagaceae bacterium]MCW5929244.1 TonB-dependent receptor [Chitinophagaceae bacterium]